ncbi:hypothetical protein NVP1005O_30 [Vibrio phage 1.005.O._10N.286.48.F2]|nr:hypothetical protein NVP1005O_30 [Vibrio phage 1.005.O._10N.286.48.F2]
MTTYNSYEAAKIASPDSEIYKLNGVNEFIPGVDLGDIVRIHSRDDDAVKCNPADHCMTVEKFLADGHKLAMGDIVMNSSGAVVGMNYSRCLSDFGVLNSASHKEYILRAAALEEKPSENVEWVNGDECVFTDKNGDEKTCKVIGLYPPFVESYVLHCESANPTFFISNVGRMVKPETKQQREDRERLEAAYDLYCYAIDKETTFDSFCNFGPLKDIYIKIVDKTNYRKG